MGATYVARNGQETGSLWACHNDREEDQLRSPRESRVTLSHRFRAGQRDRCTAAHVAPFNSDAQNSTCVRCVQVKTVVEMRGLEPLTPSLQRRCSPS